MVANSPSPIPAATPKIPTQIARRVRRRLRPIATNSENTEAEKPHFATSLLPVITGRPTTPAAIRQEQSSADQTLTADLKQPARQRMRHQAIAQRLDTSSPSTLAAENPENQPSWLREARKFASVSAAQLAVAPHQAGRPPLPRAVEALPTADLAKPSTPKVGALPAIRAGRGFVTQATPLKSLRPTSGKK
jgi:hypothetical protein